jgi:hypothetical protein
MQGTINWLSSGLAALAFILAMAGCGQAPTMIIDDRAGIRQHEQMGMVPQPSGESTDRSLWMDMQGGG